MRGSTATGENFSLVQSSLLLSAKPRRRALALAVNGCVWEFRSCQVASVSEKEKKKRNNKKKRLV